MNRLMRVVSLLMLMGCLSLALDAAAWPETPAVELRGALAVPGSCSAPLASDTTRQVARVKVRGEDGTFRNAWELQGSPLSEWVPEAVLTKKQTDGFDRMLDLVMIGVDGTGRQAVFSMGEVYLGNGANTILVAGRYRWILPHKHPELPDAAREQLAWQSVATEPAGFRTSCLGCHAAGAQRELHRPRGLVLAASGDVADDRLVNGLQALEIRQTMGLPEITMEKSARDTMFVEDPAVVIDGVPVGSLSAFLASAAVPVEFRDDTVGLGKGFHGRHVWKGHDLVSVLRRAAPAADLIHGYLLVTGADGYRCAFSGGEIAAGRFPAAVVVVDDEDLKPIGPGKGRYKIMSRLDYFIDRAVRSVAELRWVTVK